ncbi:MAG: methylamine dehydrogenase accessory protein MauD [Deltaproteobacteria bacterium]|nr:methylamine dehydrogenase accessory protein MauD [Deltaproteobacteria bacterium]MBW2395881.1 methylamine dehydrogenase accessory protein MauD [Deltaproteobacteria bacterium]
MTEALLVSNVILWVLVVALGLVAVALTRQIGLLHERIAPVGALATSAGLDVGDDVPELALQTLDGAELQLAAQRTLLFFLSPTCPVCETILPTLKRIEREEASSLRIVLASDGDPEEHARFAREKQLDRSAYVLSQELGMRFEVAKLPYAVLIDGAGRVAAKGIVNTREHIESLFEAERLQVASIQEYLQQTDEIPMLELPRAGAES